MKTKATIDFIGEIRDGLVQWMKDQYMIGDYIIHFSNKTRVFGHIADPRGPRWVHVFIQNPHSPRQFEYNVAVVDDNKPVYVTVVDKKAELKKAATYEARLTSTATSDAIDEAIVEAASRAVAEARLEVSKNFFFDELERGTDDKD